MQITKKIEKEILQVMEGYWGSYLRGDLQTWASYLPDQYKNIGTTKAEIWNSKKEIVNFTEKVIDQTAGMAETRNKKTQIIPYDPYVMVHELGDLFVRAEEGWIFYAPFRLSSLLEKTKNRWKILHQHGSYPDSKTEEGEPFGFDELKVENKKLQDAIQSRTIELEQKNRELEIETALERIRAQVTGMEKSEDLLDIIVSMRTEFVRLGHEAHYFWHMRWLPDKYEKAMTSGDGTRIGMVMKLPRRIHGEIPALAKWEKSGEPTVIFPMDVEATLDYVHKMANWGDFERIDPNMPTEDYIRHIGGLTYVMARTSLGEIGYSLPGIVKKVPKADLDILVRFARAFDLAHKRFEDLKTRERQSRETQIELALEKVRTRSLAVKRSDEFNDVVGVVFEKLSELNIPVDSVTIALTIDGTKDWDVYGCGEGDTGLSLIKFTLPYFPNAFSADILAAQNSAVSGYFSKVYSEAEKNEYYEFAFKNTELKNLPDDLKQRVWQSKSYALSVAHTKNASIMVNEFDGNVLDESQADILKRFSRVFEQAYIRFLDLQKAEAQAREAQIEAAVERVRAEAMAMHSTTDFEKVNRQLLEQVKRLDLDGFTGASILLIDEEEFFTWWDFSSPGNFEDPKSQISRYNAHNYRYLGTDVLNKWKEGENYMVFDYDLEKLQAAIKEWEDINKDIAETFKEAIAGGHLTHQWNPCGRLSNGLLAFDMVKPPDYDVRNITIKMTHAFEQAYTRFLDLQKAEAQAKEAQIEAALERTRTQSMLMQHSDELDRTIQVFHEQLHLLGISSEFSYLWLPDEEKSTHLFWATWFETKIKKGGTLEMLSTLKTKSVVYPLDKTEPSIAECYVAWESGETIHVNPISAEGVKEYFETWEELLRGAEQFKAENFPKGIYYVDAYMKYGCFGIMIRELLSEDEKNILSRFTKEFERAYTRFLDLQKAEAQAREAQIEAALERVRSRAIAMRHSDELSEAAELLYQEFFKLGVESFSCGYLINDDEEMVWKVYMTNPGEPFFKEYWTVPMEGEVSLKNRYESWKRKEEFHCDVLEGEANRKHHEFIAQYAPWKAEMLDSLPPKLVFNSAHFSLGHLLVITPEKLNRDLEGALVRFASVFDLAYQRFIDLQKAEAQAREAQIEAALEKVRSRTMTMHSPDELQEVVAIVAEKLQNLGVILDANGVILCTYFENSKDVMHWISAPDFSGSGKYLLPYFDHPIFKAAWESRLSGAEYFSKSFSVKEKNSFFEYAFEHSDYKHFPDDFKEWVFQNDKHSLSFAWSENSAILIPSHTGVVPNETDIEILKRFAKVFEQAYIRFMDLQTKEEQAVKILEEKKRLEETLHDLKATQTQLIQSEKMASLGELTAGIAHEIQNPLNFVNNFSEVSNELIGEMSEELDNGDLEEAKAIANDLKQNLEKINHHGKRADAIVKGMLQHSRKSTATKELTDINKLADEYLRLAYHGLRAKDKSFNATLNTDFDASLEKVMVIPQDMGRVVLNLFTNAFYAVNEKNKNSGNGFQPTVTVSTKKMADQIIIAVKDNGNGVPPEVLEKIFQPFFTTKPTGQGTGLGLSLAFDIVTKGHGGELKVNTTAGEGSTFIISIPNKQ